MDLEEDPVAVFYMTQGGDIFISPCNIVAQLLYWVFQEMLMDNVAL